jgi:uncharacterized protein (DUF1501 family)
MTSSREAVGQLDALKSTLAPLQGLRYPFAAGGEYPADIASGFPARLAVIAEMIHRGLPLRCVAIQSAGGYDTHSNHHGALNGSFKLDCDSIYGFQRDLEARGVADRVLIHVWSEFGRRVPENGPDGCDHGAAGISFVIGTQTRGQMVGELPGLTNLDAFDNLRPTSDYRGLYCSLLEQWFGVDAAPIIPSAASFARPQLLAA